MRDAVVFRNEGLIDIRAIKTFGVNSKETTNPIGYFGTGLKYAIAVLLRTDHDVVIYRGKQRYEFGLLETKIRVDDFKIITMNGEELAFTTELGRGWSVENAFRELYCNCIDEKGKVHRGGVRLTLGEEGHTNVIVQGAQFSALFAKRHEIVFTGEPIKDFGDVQIIRRSDADDEGHFMYYRGVKCRKLRYQPTFVYSIVGKLTLTEDRTLKYSFEADRYIADMLFTCDDEEIILEVLQDKDSYEQHIDFSFAFATPSKRFLDCIERIRKYNPLVIPKSLEDIWKLHRGGKGDFYELAMTPVRQQQLDRAIAFCKKLDIPVDMYEIRCVETMGPNNLGLAKDGVIFINRRTFEEGMHTLVHALIEEYVHIRYGVADFTRDFQNTVIRMLISTGENLLGEPL